MKNENATILDRPKSRPRAPKVEGDAGVLEKIASLPEPYRAMGERLHALIRASAPTLEPKLWYGLPAYAKDGKVVVFFRSGHTFKERYMTVGFNDAARLDDGGLWPVGFALTELGEAEEARLGDLVKRAVG